MKIKKINPAIPLVELVETSSSVPFDKLRERGL